MKTFVTAILLLALAGGASATILYQQSFEDPSWVGDQYVDTGDPAFDHDLVNNTGQSAVDGPGFDATYINSRDDVGLTDGDYVGVTDFTGTVGNFVDGTQGYQMQDADGTMVLTFDAVPGATHCSFWLFIQETGYETDDAIIVTYGDVTFLDTTGQDINDLGIEGMWMYFFSAVNNGSLTVSLQSNSGTEALFLDHVLISDSGNIPNEEKAWGDVKALFR